MFLLATIPAGLEPAVAALFVILLVEAYIDLFYLKVPNVITYPMIFCGWILAFVLGGVYGADPSRIHSSHLTLFWSITFDLYGPWVWGLDFLWSSFAMTFLAMAGLLWLYALGGMGAGDVKMLSGYGAWIAAIYGWDKGFWIVLLSFAFALVIGGVISAFMIWWRGEFHRNIQNTKDILGDIAQGVAQGKMQEIGQKAAERKPRLQLLPYGVPLCIGFIAWVIIDQWNMYYLVSWLFPRSLLPQ